MHYARLKKEVFSNPNIYYTIDTTLSKSPKYLMVIIIG